MKAKTEHCGLNSDLTLGDASPSPLTVRATNLSLTKQEDQLIECRLTFSVNPELYQRIDTLSLFNLKPELRGAFTGEFLLSPDINIGSMSMNAMSINTRKPHQDFFTDHQYNRR